MSEQFDDLLPDLEGFDEKEDREFLERAHQINQLTQHPGWAVYCDYLVDLTTNLQERILFGRCTSFDDYKEKTGRVAGLRLAIHAPDKLAQSVQALHEQALLDEETVEFDRGG